MYSGGRRPDPQCHPGPAGPGGGTGGAEPGFAHRRVLHRLRPLGRDGALPSGPPAGLGPQRAAGPGDFRGGCARAGGLRRLRGHWDCHPEPGGEPPDHCRRGQCDGTLPV